jgi:hypothetical protein
MANEPKIQRAFLAGHGTSTDGHHALLGFDTSERHRLVLAVPVEQAAQIVSAGVAISAEARQKLGDAGPVPPTFQIERWSMAPKGDDLTVLTFTLAGGTQLRLEVTPTTVREGED